VAQVETIDKMTKASAAATAYFNHAASTDVVSSTLAFAPNSAQTSFTLSAKSWVRTPFLGALNSWFQRPSLSGAPAQCEGNLYGCVTLTTTATSELKTGGESGSNVELALMMDVTGSMCSPCTKIDDAKLAAKDLIDIVIWSDQSAYTSKIALAPFAAAVNGGITFAPLMRGTVTANAQGSPQVLDIANAASQPTDRWIQFQKASGGNACSGSNCTWQISTKCVTERIGAERYTDAPPSTAYLGKAYFGSGNPDQSCVIANYTDPEVNSIQPLSNDKTMLKRRIDKLQTGGSTGGHLGTAWA